MASREIALEILGTGEHVPSQRIDSQEFDRSFGKAPGWTFERTGVRVRGFAPDGENVVAMGVAAARHALQSAGVDGASLDAIIAVGSVPAQAIPCTAVLLQQQLGLSLSGIPAFDINATCLGFLAALDLVAQGIATGRYRAVLIVASERPSLGMRKGDSSTAGLFGDGAGAVVVGAARNGGAALLASHFQTFSAGAQFCRLRAGGTDINPHKDTDAFLDATFFEMRGRPMYRMASERMPGFLDTLLARAGLDRDGVNVWVPHQASGHAIRHMREALGLQTGNFVDTLETHGNQVSASMPVALHHALQTQRIKTGSVVALLGTGAGLSFGGAVLRF